MGKKKTLVNSHLTFVLDASSQKRVRVSSLYLNVELNDVNRPGLPTVMIMTMVSRMTKAIRGCLLF